MDHRHIGRTQTKSPQFRANLFPIDAAHRGLIVTENRSAGKMAFSETLKQFIPLNEREYRKNENCGQSISQKRNHFHVALSKRRG